ncbi:MAG: Calx-beta domain-containing protein [Chloroflexota bacterium]
MNRKLFPLLFPVLAALLLLPALLTLLQRNRVVYAATITVNTLTDEADGECIVDCSLRDAITVAANGDTIALPAGSYVLSGALGEISINKNVTIAGAGAATVVLQAGANSRHFAILGGTVTVSNLTLQGGKPDVDRGGSIATTGGANLVLNSVVITNNQTTGNGGAIALDKGALTLNNSIIVSNTAGSHGGGIFNQEGTITFNNSQVITNSAVGSGGGIYINTALANLTMNGGKINGNIGNSTTADNAFASGGVHLTAGTMTLNSGEIRGNKGYRGGGVFASSSGSFIMNDGLIIENEAAYGGGIYVQQSDATATINGGQITQNRSLASDFGGGGFYIFRGMITMNGGELSQNSANHDGGGMEIGDASGRFVMNGGVIFGNTAVGTGGAIYSDEGVITINGGTLHSNTSGENGGAISATSAGVASITSINASAILTNTSTAGSGGAIYSEGILTVTNVTLSGNSALSGGGVFNDVGGTAVLRNNTITSNSDGIANTGNLSVGNSIIYANTGADCSGSRTVTGPNISSCGGGDSNSNPLLQPLALNGGSSLNYALGSGSPAIDTGSNAICTPADQRGNLRPVNICDIGAYESGVAFFINDASVTEGNSGSKLMTFTVSRSFMVNTTTRVDYATVAGTAVAGADFTAVPTTTLTFLPATMTQTITVPILGDTLDEADEQFTVRLGNQSPGVQVGDFSGIGTILDDDTPQLTISDVTFVELDAGTETAVFIVTQSIPSTKIITVNYATANGTATAGSDYTATSGTLTFTPGQTSKTISVTILPDALTENSEYCTVNLSNASNANILDGSGRGTILDNYTVLLPLVVAP